MKKLNPNELKSMLDQNEDLALIKVLGREDFQRGHIPGSRNVPVDRDGFSARSSESPGARASPSSCTVIDATL